MRKAVIVPFALGMVILSGLFLFGGSVADEMLQKNLLWLQRTIII